jgi:hydrogenase-4 component F
MPVLLLLAIPATTAVVCLLATRSALLGKIQSVGMLVLFGVGLWIIGGILQHEHWALFQHAFYLDALSGLMILLITLISLLASFYSGHYMEAHECEHHGESDLGNLKGYYVLMNLFIVTMLFLAITNNLGLFWIGVEITTLVSAFLVGYDRKETSVEAAWKYIILCTVGLAFGLIGLIIASYAVTKAGGNLEASLYWDYLRSIASTMNPALMKIAFVFIFIGYGTKMGLAPMHSWLPDAHSESPTPISALLSGVLLNCALYGIIRFGILVNQAIDPHFTTTFLLTFGLISIAIATPFLLIQKNIKRMLAYSSLEHIGIIATGLGFGTPLAVFGALFHILNHALIKSLMFFSAGNLILRYHTKELSLMRNIAEKAPVSGGLFLMGGLALLGSPPFSVFNSEFMILSGGFHQPKWPAVILIVFLLTVIFAGLLYQLLQMLRQDRHSHQPETPDGALVASPSELTPGSLLALTIPMLLLLTVAWWIPQPLSLLLQRATQIITGGLPG